MQGPSPQDALSDLRRQTAQALEQAARPFWPIGLAAALGGAVTALLAV